MGTGDLFSPAHGPDHGWHHHHEDLGRERHTGHRGPPQTAHQIKETSPCPSSTYASPMKVPRPNRNNSSSRASPTSLPMCLARTPRPPLSSLMKWKQTIGESVEKVSLNSENDNKPPVPLTHGQ